LSGYTQNKRDPTEKETTLDKGNKVNRYQADTRKRQYWVYVWVAQAPFFVDKMLLGRKEMKRFFWPYLNTETGRNDGDGEIEKAEMRLD